MAFDIAAFNPYRYRSYYYDVETGLYYLQSRYYDPEISRFVNSDSQINSNSTIHLNLYAYVLNSPTVHIDYSGKDAALIIRQDGAFGLGHAAIIVATRSESWYYCSVSSKDNDTTMIVDFLYLGHKLKFNDSISNVNKYIDEAIKRQKRYYPCKPNIITGGVYTSMHYFTGDFYESFKYFSNLHYHPKKYNLIYDNCLQNAAYALSLGMCTGELADEYQEAINALTYMTVPNSAEYALYHFENTIREYDSYSIIKKITITPRIIIFTIVYIFIIFIICIICIRI